MGKAIFYDIGSQANNSITPPATLTTTEADLFVTTDRKYMQESQITVLGSVTLGGVASATFYYYTSLDNVTWYPISLYNTSTGEITQRAVLVDSGTYVKSGASLFADNVPLGVANYFKVAGKSATGTPAYSVLVGFRNN